jgi:hypothetical protein
MSLTVRSMQGRTTIFLPAIMIGVLSEVSNAYGVTDKVAPTFPQGDFFVPTDCLRPRHPPWPPGRVTANADDPIAGTAYRGQGQLSTRRLSHTGTSLLLSQYGTR